jgi:hypothetical protein
MTGAYGQVGAFAAIAYLRPEEHLVDGKTAPDTRLSSYGRPYPLIDVRILDEKVVAVSVDLPALAGRVILDPRRPAHPGGPR